MAGGRGGFIFNGLTRLPHRAWVMQRSSYWPLFQIVPAGAPPGARPVSSGVSLFSCWAEAAAMGAFITPTLNAGWKYGQSSFRQPSSACSPPGPADRCARGWPAGGNAAWHFGTWGGWPICDIRFNADSFLSKVAFTSSDRHAVPWNQRYMHLNRGGRSPQRPLRSLQHVF